MNRLDVAKISLIMGITGVIGCGTPPAVPGSIQPSLTQCGAGVAQIWVTDGFMQNLCGCVGPGEDRKMYSSPTALTCHLANSQTQVFFYYGGALLQHQVVPTGLPSFVASPLYSPETPTFNLQHSVSLSQPTSIYSFQDSISGMTGQILVP